jgi:hypothetical protein
VVNDLLHNVEGEIVITHKDNTTAVIPFQAKANSSSLIVENYKEVDMIGLHYW